VAAWLDSDPAASAAAAGEQQAAIVMGPRPSMHALEQVRWQIERDGAQQFKLPHWAGGHEFLDPPLKVSVGRDIGIATGRGWGVLTVAWSGRRRRR
jgi:hypothetical protein